MVADADGGIDIVGPFIVLKTNTQTTVN